MHWTQTFFTDLYSKVGLSQKWIFGQVEAENVRRALKLRKGQAVLDLCCGIGRHAIPLAAAGIQVTGLDLTESYLKQARANARRAGVKVRFVHGNMRSLPYSSEFHAVINLFTSFGFYDDRKNQKVLEGVARALRPGGRFIIDVQNRDWLIKNFQPWMVTEIGKDLVITEHDWEPMTSRINAQWRIVRGDRVQKMGGFSLRTYAIHELTAMIEAAGLTVIETYGGLELSPFRMDSRRIVIVARKQTY